MRDRSGPAPRRTHSVQDCVAEVHGPDAGLDWRCATRRKRAAVMGRDDTSSVAMKPHVWLSLFAAAALLQPQVGPEVSVAEIEKTLHAIDVDRTAASDGERASAEYLDRALTAYGVAHVKYEARLYL